MDNHQESQDEPLTTFRVALDDATVAKLMEFADLCHAPPVTLMAAIIREFLENHSEAHEVPPEKVTLQ